MFPRHTRLTKSLPSSWIWISKWLPRNKIRIQMISINFAHWRGSIDNVFRKSHESSMTKAMSRFTASLKIGSDPVNFQCNQSRKEESSGGRRNVFRSFLNPTTVSVPLIFSGRLVVTRPAGSNFVLIFSGLCSIGNGARAISWSNIRQDEQILSRRSKWSGRHIYIPLQ